MVADEAKGNTTMNSKIASAFVGWVSLLRNPAPRLTTVTEMLGRVPAYALLVSFHALCLPLALTAADPQSEEVRSAVEISLPFLWEEGQSWIDKRGCVSCHQVPFMAWSLNAAAHQGFEVDATKLAELNSYATQITNFSNPKNKSDQTEEERAKANIDTMAQLLFATQYDDTKANTESKAKFVGYLIDAQNEDGTWKACGQLPFQKRPKPETSEVTTAWTILALGSHELEVPLTEIAKAFSADGISTEWWVTQLLLSHQRSDEEKVNTLTEKLITFQNDDGGWGWLTNEESDAFGTGLALYTLKKIGFPGDASVMTNATQFLTSSQQPNGSWEVRSTKAKNQKKVTPTAIYWGTAWAVIGLLESHASVN